MFVFPVGVLLRRSCSAILLNCFIGLVAGLLLATSANAQPLLTTKRVAVGLTQPIFVTAAPGDDSRLFVVEQSGRIRILDKATGNIATAPFLNLSGSISSPNGEEGLLGMAFSPNFQEDGHFFVNLTTRVDGALQTEVRRYTVSSTNPNVASGSSRLPILSFRQPFSNHNAGWMGFSPNDGYLYIASGDGGSGNDPGNRAQDITDQRLGKMLRIDVSQSTTETPYTVPTTNPFVNRDGDDEIWAYGLRNPWRNSFDRETGDLWIADVGQNVIEEINFQPANSSGGENYGWRVKEGNNNTGLDNPPNFQSVAPIHTYTHALGQSITGGYVYRGDGIGGVQPLDGTYFYADFVASRIWSLRELEGRAANVTERTSELRPPSGQGSISSISSFGEDNQGNLYIVDYGGEIFQIVAVPALGDVDKNGDVSLKDFAILRASYNQRGEGLPADLDADGLVNIADFSILRRWFGTDSRSQRNAAPVPELAGRTAGIFFALICIALSIGRRSGSNSFFGFRKLK